MTSAIDKILEEQTVFILGAGASSPYNFPLGKQLKDNILKYPDDEINTILDVDERGFLTELIPEFKEILRYGDYSTIDEFLEHKGRFRKLGAYYIVAALGKLERPEHLFPQRDLYAELFKIFDIGSENGNILPIKVVSLNYERSLEYFLNKNCLYNCSEDSEKTALNKVSRIQIIHAHGSLGELDSVPYGKVLKEQSHVKKAVDNIKIISDRLDDSEDFQNAQTIIAEARSIIFLGFGYHARTLKSLFAKSDLNTKDIYGTTYKLDQADKTTMYELTSKAKTKFFGNDSEDCAMFSKRLQQE